MAKSYGSKQRRHFRQGVGGRSVWERNSLLRELWDFSPCRPFTCTYMHSNLYNTLQEREKPPKIIIGPLETDNLLLWTACVMGYGSNLVNVLNPFP